MATAEDDKSFASSEGSLWPLRAVGNDDASYASTADEEKDDDNKTQHSYQERSNH